MRGRHRFASSVGRREKLHYIAARPADQGKSQWATRSAAPIPYMQRTRDYYAALGYPAYQWAHFDTVPFAVPAAPLSRSRVVLLTTAARFDPALGDQGPGAAYNAAAKFYRVYRAPVAPPPDLRISHIGYDRKHTSAADPNTWLPIAALQDAVTRGVVGSLARELIGVPTDRSQRATLERDAPDALAACRELRRRRRSARAELSGLSSIDESRRAAPGGKRRPNGRDGVRARHRRICRRAAFSLQRLSARQFGRQAVRSGIAAGNTRRSARVVRNGHAAIARRACRRRSGATILAGKTTS